MQTKTTSKKPSLVPASSETSTAETSTAESSLIPVGTALATTSAPPAEQEYVREDLKIPRVEIKHGVDTRFADIIPGQFVLNRPMDEDYFTLKIPTPVIFLDVNRGWLEDVEPGSGSIPLSFRTKAEVEEAGGTTERNHPDKTLFKRFADTLILIEQNSANFWPDTMTFEVKGITWILATYRIKASAYSAIGSVIGNWDFAQRRSTEPRHDYWAVRWMLGTVLNRGMSFSYFVPTLKKIREHTPEEYATLKEIADNLR
jgi:hypothetical protein